MLRYSPELRKEMLAAFDKDGNFKHDNYLKLVD